MYLNEEAAVCPIYLESQHRKFSNGVDVASVTNPMGHSGFRELNPRKAGQEDIILCCSRADWVNHGGFGQASPKLWLRLNMGTLWVWK